jgi:hypothetical protein
MQKDALVVITHCKYQFFIQVRLVSESCTASLAASTLPSKQNAFEFKLIPILFIWQLFTANRHLFLWIFTF